MAGMHDTCRPMLAPPLNDVQQKSCSPRYVGKRIRFLYAGWLISSTRSGGMAQWHMTFVTGRCGSVVFLDPIPRLFCTEAALTSLESLLSSLADAIAISRRCS
jgi:hypothetical protein